MKISTAFIAITLMFFTSCINSTFYENIAVKVDSLNASLEASASSYESLDTILIARQYNTIVEHMDSLKVYESLATTPLLVEYKYVRKNYKTFFRGHPLTIKELNYSRAQLAALKNDFEHYQPDTEDARLYFKQEKEAITYIKKRMDAYQKLIIEGMNRFDTLNPQVEKMLDSIYNTNQQ